MSQCRQSASEFIQSTFCPHVAVLCSADAQLLCQKNNLNFLQLIQPFCRLSSEVHIRDANNVTHSIHNLRISTCDMAAQPPQHNVIKKQLNDAVSSSYGQTLEMGASNVISVGNYDLQLSASTPWFESWRETFLQLLPPTDHEYLNHCLACIFVVASTNSDPLSTFTSLANQQVSQQQQFPNRLPRWFCQGILHYYVLLHDVVDSEQSRAEAIYQSMKATFGVQICHLLQINSRSLTTVESIRSGIPIQPDPWSQFLAKPSHSTESFEIDHVSVADESVAYPADLSESSPEQAAESVMANSFYDNEFEESGSSGVTSYDNLSHPLASPTTPPSRDTPSPDSDPTAAASGFPGENLHHLSSHHRGIDLNQNKPHGMCLTPSDLDRLRIFVHEFVVRALIPWVERQIKIFNEQLTSRKGIHRSFFMQTKKWFGTKPSGPVPASQNTTVVYAKDAPELQLRRLADLAFLFQMYDFAYSTYHTVKKDFNNDQAWLYFAGALEMASLAVFLQDQQNQKQYPQHYMETAISTYFTSCRNPHYANRATLTSTEALKKRGMYNEAAMQFLKMTSEDSDLTSALFLEQAAHCFLALKNSMVRKYAFHMILAGHRFNKAGQRKHSLRCYAQAQQVYKGKHWSIAEDHIHFTVGKQSFNLKQLESATAAFKHLLKEESRQSSSQQAMYLREYIFVYKQLLSQEERNSCAFGRLPELPLPLVDSNATKVLLSVSHGEDVSSRKTLASRVWLDSDTDNQDGWRVLEEKLVQASGQIYRANPQLFTNSTDNRSSPVAFVGEPVSVEVQVENPLHVILVLSDISLLWTFVPATRGPDSQQVISNEVTASVKNNLADEIVQTSIVREVVVPGIQSEKVQLILTPRQPGQLRVVGLAYNLGTSSAAHSSSLQEADVHTTDQHKPSYTNTVQVRGKQKLEPQGPRLNSSKEERTQKLYGPDRRLDLLVYEETPSLEVAFSKFPESLLCGEVQCVEMEFTNVGKVSLKSLKVTSNYPGFFTFGCSSELPASPHVYQIRTSQCRSSSSVLTSVKTGTDEFLTFPDVISIPLPKGELCSEETVSLPMWIRGDDTGGIHEVDFLFYYEPVKHSTIRYRVLHHRAVVHTMESLSVHTAVARPAGRITSAGGQELNSCIVSCELENLSQTQFQVPHVQELQVTQVSCISPRWTVVSIGAKHYTGVRLKSQECLHLVVKGLEQEESGELMCSEVTFDEYHVNSLCSPCSDFFIRSWQQHKALTPVPSSGKVITARNSKMEGCELTQPSSAVIVRLTLVFLWKAYVVQDDGQIKPVLGQHHAHIDHLSELPVSGLVVPSVPCIPQLKLKQDSERDDKPLSDPDVAAHSLTYSFSHSSQKEHRFAGGICIVPVGLTVQNLTEVEVAVFVNTSGSPEALISENSELFNSFCLYPPSVKWIGLTQASLTLSRGQSSHLALKVGITRPGTYNLNTISVFVTSGSDQSEMVLQKHTTPSIITVVNRL